ncbi:MAG: hypothetical protein QW244_01890 [Candidatus Pacearchaeota archaeon]
MQLEEIVKEKQTIYEKHYKLLTFLSLCLLIVALIYLTFYFFSSGELFKKDISLKGGTTLTLTGNYDKSTLERELKKFTNSYIIKYTKNSYTGEIVASVIDADINEEEARKIASMLNLSEADYSIETMSSSLGENFFRQLEISLLIAFLFMGIIVFILFRTFVPSIAVILAALTDMIVCLAIINLIGKPISTAGIAAFLMLIGYSVDTDIMLTIKVLKRREQKLSERLLSALKTGLTMSLIAFFASLVGFLFSMSSVLKEIFLILMIGIAIDIFSTWVGNASIITWYVKKRYNE